MKLDRWKKAATGAALALVFVFGTEAFLATTAQAQWGRDRYRYGQRGYGNNGLSNNGRQVAEQRGYSTGLDRGRDDARDGRSFNPNNSDHYRHGDSGYHSEYGNKEAYRSVYRAAFRRGYEQGYRQARGRFRRW